LSWKQEECSAETRRFRLVLSNGLILAKKMVIEKKKRKFWDIGVGTGPLVK